MMATITFYGGVNEIGGNKILVEDNDSRVLLDFGVCFDRKGKFYEEYLQPRTNNALRDLLRLGVVPPIDGIYRNDLLGVEGIDEVLQEHGINDDSLWKSPTLSYDEVRARDGTPYVDAILVSHAHEDHFKYISLLDEKIPVYCTEITKAVIEAAEELGREGFEYEFTAAKRKSLTRLQSGYFPGGLTLKSGESLSRQYVLIKAPVTIGSIHVRAIPVDHSVPGAASFLLTLSNGVTVLYTGDLRFHGCRGDYTTEFRNAVRGLKPDMLICEGTRIAEPLPDSETAVEDELITLVSATPGLVMVGFAWKDTARYQTLKNVAERTGRTLVVSPKLAYLLNKLKGIPEAGIGDVLLERGVRVYLERKGSMLYSKGDYVNSKYDIGFSTSWDRNDRSTIRTEHYDRGVRAYEIRRNPSKYIIHMDFYDFNELVDLEPPSCSMFIGAKSEPFNEEMKLDEARLKHWLQLFDINAPGHEPLYIHASGHASGTELVEMIKEIKPRFLVPVHTEHPEYFLEALRGEPIEVRLPEYGVPMPLS